MDKKKCGKAFQQRLRTALEQTGDTVSGFCREHDLDRPTITQLLLAKDYRMPRGDTLAALATALNVSADWLLGLSEDPQKGIELVDAAINIGIERAVPSSLSIADWHRQVPDSKIRCVSPLGIPDQLKTDDTLLYEYLPIYGTEKKVRAFIESADRRVITERRRKDYEVCISQQRLHDFAHGAWLWGSMPARQRRKQLEYMADEADALYPHFRLHVFDEMQMLSNSFYVFGSKAAMWVTDTGKLVFNRATHIDYFNNMFDSYIRHTVVHPHEAAAYIRKLAESVR